MKKKLSVLLALMSIGTIPLLADSNSFVETTQKAKEFFGTAAKEEKYLGKTAVSQIRESYVAGEYQQFLDEMDEKYKEAVASGEIDALAALRPGGSSELQQWEAKAFLLQGERNKELLALVDLEKNHSPQTNSLMLEKLESAATNRSNEMQHLAIEVLSQYRQIAPGKGMSSDENLLIQIDLEYEYKALHLDLPNASLSEKRAKQCALKMEKLEVLQKLSEQFSDPEFKEIIDIYAAQFDERLAQSYDMADLNGLINGSEKPSNAFEEKIASILTAYQDKFSDLTKQFIDQDNR
jgi:hypothetical protein